MRTLKVSYFAWVRERIGLAEETVALPDSVTTAGAVLAFLAARDERYAYAFETPALIRIALDKRHAAPESDLGAAREIAFFPPMTGG